MAREGLSIKKKKKMIKDVMRREEQQSWVIMAKPVPGFIPFDRY